MKIIDISSRNFDIVYNNKDKNNKDNNNNNNNNLLSYLSLYFNDSNIFVMGSINDLTTYYLSYNPNNTVYSISASNKHENIKNIVYVDQDNYKLLECNKKLLDSCIIFLHFDDNVNNFREMYSYLKNVNYQGLVILNQEDIMNYNNDNNNIYDMFNDRIIISEGFIIINLSLDIEIIMNTKDLSSDISNILDTLQMIETINEYNCSNKKHNINLYCSYYKDKNPERQIEVEKCLEMNVKNPSINRIIIINESDEDIKENDKVKVIKTDKRYKFIDFFMTSNENTNENDINILINSDIIIGKGFETLELDSNKFICLSRHDIESNGNIRMNVGGGSHDCWVWRGYMLNNLYITGNFYMGKFLCDGVLANQLYSSGYLLKNPVYGLMIYHYHTSNIRNYSYDINDIIKGQRRGIKFSENDNVYIDTDLYDDGFNG